MTAVPQVSFRAVRPRFRRAGSRLVPALGLVLAALAPLWARINVKAGDRPANPEADAAALTDQAASVCGADELFWVPTLEQAEAMANANGIPIFVMGYSLVDERSTYTKLSEEYCSAVF